MPVLIADSWTPGAFCVQPGAASRVAWSVCTPERSNEKGSYPLRTAVNSFDFVSPLEGSGSGLGGGEKWPWGAAVDKGLTAGAGHADPGDRSLLRERLAPRSAEVV